MSDKSSLLVSTDPPKFASIEILRCIELFGSRIRFLRRIVLPTRPTPKMLRDQPRNVPSHRRPCVPNVFPKPIPKNPKRNRKRTKRSQQRREQSSDQGRFRRLRPSSFNLKLPDRIGDHRLRIVKLFRSRRWFGRKIAWKHRTNDVPVRDNGVSQYEE